jgi:LPXTG-motif cell wall-anchored protein
VTGTNAIGIAGLGAAIAAGGVGLVLVTRRRRPDNADA